MTYTTFIFDFDYTLADSSKGVFLCINHALTRMGLYRVSMEETNATIGLSLKEAFLRLAGVQYVGRSDEFISLFREKADEIMADATVFFERAVENLNYLKDHEFHIGIVSTKYRYRIEGLLKREGLEKCVDVIIGGEDVTVSKPDPEGLLMAAEKLGVDLKDVLYIGDSVVDAKTAAAAGVDFMAVLTGVTRHVDFEGYLCKQVLKDLNELRRVVHERLLSGPCILG